VGGGKKTRIIGNWGGSWVGEKKPLKQRTEKMGNCNFSKEGRDKRMRKETSNVTRGVRNV